MLKDLSGRSDDADFAIGPEQQAGAADAPNPDHACGRFRASLWLSLAADIRRRQSPQQMKGTVPC